MDASLMTPLTELEAEYVRQKKRYAEERLKAEIVRDALEKMLKPSRAPSREVPDRGTGIRVARAAFGISESCYRYQAKGSSEHVQIADHLIRSTHGLCFLFLRNVQGYLWNHKLVYRIHHELKLNLRINRANESYANDWGRWPRLRRSINPGDGRHA